METSKNINLSACLNRLQQKQFEAVTLDQDYIPVRGTWNAGGSGADFDLDEHIDGFIVNEQKVLLLLGDSGAGKSLFCQQLQQRLLKYHLSDPTKHSLPLFISLPSSKDPVSQVIETALLELDCSLEKIDLLKQSQRFIFILDGYDEIRQAKNLYVSNHLKDWQAKVIITCRSQYLQTLDYHSPYFMPYEGQKPQGWLLSEVVVKPFNQNQIDAYLQQYVKHHTTEWQDWQKYQRAIAEMPGLKALIQTPFLLKLAVEAMPGIVALYERQADQIQYKNLTQAKLYDVFVEQWFTRQEDKLKVNGQLKVDKTIKPKLWAYARNLAKAMHQAKVTQIKYEGNQNLFAEVDCTNPWEQFFAEDAETQLIRHASLLKKVGEHQYAFFHASLIDYFVSTEIHYQPQLISDTNQQIDNAKLEQTDTPKEKNPQDNQQEKNINEIKICDEQETSKFKNYFTSTNLPSHYHYFNQQLLIKERGMLQFFADRVQEDANFKQDLFKILEGSKYDEAMRIAAANAITVLNKANVSFGMQDFAGIRIPYADLSYSNCDHINFKGADLTGVNFTQAWLRKANLSYTHMAEVEFGQLPAIKHQFPVTAIAYEASGQRILSVDKSRLLIWNLETQDILQELNTGENWIYSAAFSPNGEMIAAAGDGKEIILWNLVTQEVKRLVHVDAINAVVFSPDSQQVIMGDEKGKLSLITLATGAMQTLIKCNSAIRSVAYSKDGVYIALGLDDTHVGLWKVNDQELQLFKGHKGNVNVVAFSPIDHLLASGSNDKTIRLWTLKGQQERVIKKHKKAVLTLAFSPDGIKLASGSKDNLINISDLIAHTDTLLQGHNDNVQALVFSSDGGTLISGSRDTNVRIWKLTAEQRSFAQGHTQPVNAIAFSPDGQQLASASDDSTIRLVNLSTGRVRVLTGDAPINSIAFSPDGNYLVSGGEDARVYLWILADGSNKKVDKHSDVINAVAFSPNGAYLASAYDSLHLLELTTSKVNKLFHSEDDAIGCIRFSPDGKSLAVGYTGGELQLWDLDTGKFKVLEGHTHEIWSVTFSSDGKKLISGCMDKTLRIWDLITGEVQVWEAADCIKTIALSPDDKYILSGSKMGILQIWEVSTGQCIEQFKDTDVIMDIKFDPQNSRHFAIASQDGSVKRWRIFRNGDDFDWQLIESSHAMVLNYEAVSVENVYELSFFNQKLIAKQSYKLFDHDAHYYNNMGDTKYNSKNYTAAIDDYTKAIQLNPKYSAAFYNRGMSKYELNLYEAAIIDFDRVIILNPKNEIAFNFRGLSKYELRLFKESIKDYDNAIELNPQYSVAFHNRGLTKNDLGNYEEAILDYDKAIELEPNDPVTYSNRGWCKDNLKQYEAAIEDYDHAIKLNPNYATAFYNRGRSKRNLKQYEAAIKDYNCAIELNPNHATAFHERGLSKYELQDYHGSIEDNTKAIKLNPKNAITFSNRGWSKHNLKQYGSAIEDYSCAIELDPNYAVAFHNRGLSKYNIQDYLGSIEDNTRAIDLDPNYSVAFINRGLCKDNLGCFEEGIKDYNHAIELNPNYVLAFNNRGFSHECLGDYEAALKDYNQAIILNSKDTFAYSKRGLAKARLGYYQEALVDSEQALTLASDINDKIIQGRFAVVWAYQGKAEKARQHLAEIKSDPNELYFEYYFNGWVELLLCNYQKAITYFDKVLIEKIGRHYYLAASLMLRGKAYLALGNSMQAQLDMEAALKKIPNHQEWMRWYQEIFGNLNNANSTKLSNKKIAFNLAINNIQNNNLIEKKDTAYVSLAEIEKLGEYEFLPSKGNTADNVKFAKTELNTNQNIQSDNSFLMPTKKLEIHKRITNLGELFNAEKSDHAESDSNLEAKTPHTKENTFNFWQRLDEKNNEANINNKSESKVFDNNIDNNICETIYLGEEITYLSLNNSLENISRLDNIQNKLDISNKGKNVDSDKKTDYQKSSKIDDILIKNTQTSNLQQRLQFWREKESAAQMKVEPLERNKLKSIQPLDTQSRILNK